MRGKWCTYSGARRAAPKIELADGLQPQTESMVAILKFTPWVGIDW